MEKISTLPPKTQQEVKSLYDQILEKGEREGERIGIEKGERIGIEKGERIGIEKGERIGIEKGERIGIEKTKRFTIRNGWENGVDAAIIAALLSCTTDEVQEWYKRFDAGEKPNL